MAKAFKGISPLVATFLLIAFTLVIAGILAGWATQIATQQRIASERCADARIMITAASYNAETSTLALVVENFGPVDLNYTISYVFANGTGGTVGNGQLFPAPKFTTNTTRFTISPDIEQVTIRPRECPGYPDTVPRVRIKGLGF